MTEPHDEQPGETDTGSGSPGAGSPGAGSAETGREGTPELRWADLAGAVAGAAFRVDEMTTAGFGAGASAGAASAVAASILDAAIQAIQQRRRSSTNVEPDVPLDRTVFDPQALKDLLEFLQHARRGLLTAEEIVQEARLWEQLLQAGWPADARDTITVLRAIDLLSDVPAPPLERPEPTPVEPANDLERAMAAAAGDDTARPALWQAIYQGEVVLPVVAYELIRPEGANFQFLSAPLGDTPLVLGFATEERFDALLPPGSEVSRVLAPGHDLPKIWPEGHWLMINPGYANCVVLSPWEMTGLPEGGRAELPHPRAVQIQAPDEPDDRLEILAGVVADAPEIDRVAWARVRPARAPSHAPWQDVLVVSAPPAGPAGAATPGERAEPDGPDDRVGGDPATAPSGTTPGAGGSDDTERPVRVDPAETAAVQALTSRLPAGRFPKAIVVGRQVDLAHPFIEAVVAAARQVPA